MLWTFCNALSDDQIVGFSKKYDQFVVDIVNNNNNQQNVYKLFLFLIKDEISEKPMCH